MLSIITSTMRNLIFRFKINPLYRDVTPTHLFSHYIFQLHSNYEKIKSHLQKR